MQYIYKKLHIHVTRTNIYKRGERYTKKIIKNEIQQEREKIQNRGDTWTLSKPLFGLR